MNTVDFNQVELDLLATHHVGNKAREEKLFLAKEMTVVEGGTLNYVMQYFIAPFKTEELFHFSHPDGLENNPVYKAAKKIFASRETFVEDTQEFAKLLYEASTHPNINEGKLNVAYFSEIVVNGVVSEAIGLFKSETNSAFLKMEASEEKTAIDHDYGFELKGLDKACIIFNTNEEGGYEILAIDQVNKSGEAQFWKEGFLSLKPIDNDYYKTKEFLSMTKDFLTEQVKEEFKVNKKEQVDLLNRSVDYFKKNDQFDKDEFEATVFKDPEMATSFGHFKDQYQDVMDFKEADNFAISETAVKKKAKDFKSKIKLDKNFQIYILNSRGIMEQGEDELGRKFYKFYYEDEQ